MGFFVHIYFYTFRKRMEKNIFGEKGQVKMLAFKNLFLNKFVIWSLSPAFDASGHYYYFLSGRDPNIRG